MKNEPIIGVIGGMGPYAGLDLVRKIFDQTRAATDQEHLPVALLSYSHRIADRSAFVFGRVAENPAYAIAEMARRLDALGATVAGIPCNSAHAPAIFDVLQDELRAARCRIRLLHMIDEAARYARDYGNGARRVGALSTLAVYRLCLYQTAIEGAGFEAVMPDEAVQQAVNRAIFDPAWGIKAQSNPVTETARQTVRDALAHLRDRGAEAVILGCTELPLALPEPRLDGVPLLDATQALARALIRETYPDRLR